MHNNNDNIIMHGHGLTNYLDQHDYIQLLEMDKCHVLIYEHIQVGISTQSGLLLNVKA